MEILFSLLGGLAIFLYGMHRMGSGLQEIMGKKAGRVLEILTSVPVVGMLVGTAVTIVVQSSTLVTVMVVSLVNSAMLNLKQAASVIMGANIGTTLTAQIVAFRITDAWVYGAFFGFGLFFFAKTKGLKTLGQVVFAFAMLLLGLHLMSAAMVPMRSDPTFLALIKQFSDSRVLSLLVGLAFTAVVQSSTAVTSVVIVMTMYEIIGLDAALPLILGANVGTCFTAVLASIGGTTPAKRAAAVHVVFNLAGALIFLVFLSQFERTVLAISPDGDVPRQAANAHTLFSVVTTLLFLPFINQLVRLVTFLVPDREAEPAPRGEMGSRYLDWRIVGTPALAMHLAEKELLHMAEIAGQNVRLSIEGFIGGSRKKMKRMKRQEKAVDKIEKEIVRYLAAVAQTSMGRDMSVRHAGLLHAANDIERISDHARNIVRLAESASEEKIEFPAAAAQELRELYAAVADIFEATLAAVRDNNKELVPKIKEMKKAIGAKTESIRAAHILRISEGELTARQGITFLDVVSNFERIADHSINVSHLPQGKL